MDRPADTITLGLFALRFDGDVPSFAIIEDGVAPLHAPDDDRRSRFSTGSALSAWPSVLAIGSESDLRDCADRLPVRAMFQEDGSLGVPSRWSVDRMLASALSDALPASEVLIPGTAVAFSVPVAELVLRQPLLMSAAEECRLMDRHFYGGDRAVLELDEAPVGLEQDLRVLAQTRWHPDVPAWQPTGSLLEALRERIRDIPLPSGCRLHHVARPTQVPSSIRTEAPLQQLGLR